jgi:hypothetical protein
MDATTVRNSRAPRKRGLDRKAPAPPARTRAQLGSARVARSAPTSEQAAVTPADTFMAWAEARAILWQACELDLNEAVDVLQAAAETSGLVDEIGQDAVQRILAAAFNQFRE